MNRFFFLILLLPSIVFAQNEFEATVIDAKTKKPIQNVDIYNKRDYALTNKDGSFMFTSKLDSISFKYIGYQTLKTTFNTIKNKDTIALKTKVFSLDEVVISNKTPWEKIKEAAIKNPRKGIQSEEFFLRATLKRDGEFIALEDLVGESSLLFEAKEKNNLVIELEELRKTAIRNKKVKDGNFEFFNLKTLFNIIKVYAILPKFYDLEEEYLEENYLKINFKPKNEFSYLNSKGFYVLDMNRKSIHSFNLELDKSKLKKIPFKFNVLFKWRTINYSVDIKFSYNKNKDQYYIRNTDYIETVESIRKKDGVKKVYTIESQYFVTNPNVEALLKNNISLKKDMFKLKWEYNPEFWKTQKKLVLTNEMKAFLLSLKEGNSEYVIKTNIKGN